MAPRVETGEANDAAWREMRQRLQSTTNIEPRAPHRCECCGHPAKSVCVLCGRRRSVS